MSGEQGAYPIVGAVDAGRIDEVEALRLIVEGTAAGTGKQFFDALVRHMAAAVGTGYAFVAEFLGGTRARTLAYWKKTGLHAEPSGKSYSASPTAIECGVVRPRP